VSASWADIEAPVRWNLNGPPEPGGSLSEHIRNTVREVYPKAWPAGRDPCAGAGGGEAARAARDLQPGGVRA